jgi:hypothetical protein
MEFFARCGRCNALNAAHNVGFNTLYWVGPLYDRAHPHSVLGGPGPPPPLAPPGSTPLVASAVCGTRRQQAMQTRMLQRRQEKALAMHLG